LSWSKGATCLPVDYCFCYFIVQKSNKEYCSSSSRHRYIVKWVLNKFKIVYVYYVIVLICRVPFVFQLPVSMLTSLPSLLVRVFIVTHRQPCPIVSTSCKRTVLTLMIVEKKRQVDSDCLNQSVMCFIGATMFYIWHIEGTDIPTWMWWIKLDPRTKAMNRLKSKNTAVKRWNFLQYIKNNFKVVK